VAGFPDISLYMIHSCFIARRFAASQWRWHRDCWRGALYTVLPVLHWTILHGAFCIAPDSGVLAVTILLPQLQAVQCCQHMLACGRMLFEFSSCAAQAMLIMCSQQYSQEYPVGFVSQAFMPCRCDL
jgi:hypothetical protein